MSLKSVSDATKASHRANLELLRAQLKAKYLERNEVIDGMLSAFLCRQHVLLLGVPGSAKSAVARDITGAIDGASFFSHLLTKFTVPEELFGMIDPKEFQNGRYKRDVHSMAPEAHTIFLDEVFKASSSLLNTLLTLINERTFKNDRNVLQCPLITLIGASNELPEGDDLEALFDRFVVRFWVGHMVEETNFRKLLDRKIDGTRPDLTVSLSMTDLEHCQQEVKNVRISDILRDSITVLRVRLSENGFMISNRHWEWVIELLQAYAYLNGDDEVVEDHLDILADSLWREPKDRPQLAAIIATVGNPLNVRATEIVDAAKKILDDVGKLYNPNDATAKAEWMKEASLSDTQLTQMEKELADLIAQNANRNLHKVKAAQRKIHEFKKTLAKRVSTVYGI